jgi:proteasome lid subunit RPN8/RPN11
VTSGSGAWRVWISEQARTAMVTAATRAHPRETGGVLVGVLADGRGAGRPWVTHAVEVSSPRSGRTRYELPAGARQRVVKSLRRQDARLGYLGDWHSHPINLDPSRTDATAVASISATGDCPRPLLFVLRRATSGYEIDGRQWTGVSLRRLRVLDAGPLMPKSKKTPKRRRLSSVRSRR